jgi:hypothetical protein
MSDNERIEPMALWRDWFVKSEKAWSQALTDMMGDERFSKELGRHTQEALHTHRIFSETMSQYLAHFNLPSRSDMLDIGDRLGQIEDTLAALQVELREQRLLLAKADISTVAAKEAVRPTRTKRPPDQS